MGRFADTQSIEKNLIIEDILTVKDTLIVAIAALSTRHLRSHLATQFRALSASFSAALAVVRVVATALFGAAIASFSAGSTNIRMNLGLTRHKANAHRASVRAVSTALDALCHFASHIAAKAGRHAILAVFQAGHTGIDALLHFRV